MELMLIIRVLLRRWWLVVIPIVIVTAFSLPALLDRSATTGDFTTSIRYSAAQEFNLPDRDGDYQDVWLASEYTVNAFTEWIRNSKFRDEVQSIVAAKGVDLAGLGLSTDNARSIGVIYLSYPTAEGLQIIADAFIEVLSNRNHLYFPQLGGEPATVTLLDDVIISPPVPQLANRFRPLLQIALGVVAGIGLAFLVEYLDPTLRRREELESQGIKVLAAIPRGKR